MLANTSDMAAPLPEQPEDVQHNEAIPVEGIEHRRVVIFGGHGKVALLATPKLVNAGFMVDNVIRNPEQATDVRHAGGNPIVLDMEKASADDMVNVIEGASVVVFSAGAGGGDARRTHAVDYEAAVRTMDAAQATDVSRFIMVSYSTVSVDLDRVDPQDSFYPYVQAKYDADGHLRAGTLNYTILGPGVLTMEPASGKIVVADSQGDINGENPPKDQTVTSRENVAEVMTYVIAHDVAGRRTVNFYDGQTPIGEAISAGAWDR